MAREAQDKRNGPYNGVYKRIISGSRSKSMEALLYDRVRPQNRILILDVPKLLAKSVPASSNFTSRVEDY